MRNLDKMHDEHQFVCLISILIKMVENRDKEHREKIKLLGWTRMHSQNCRREECHCR